MTTRDCSEWRGILAMHAIGRATDDEVRSLEEHLAHCEQCGQDAHDVGFAAAALGFLDDAQIERLRDEENFPASVEDGRDEERGGVGQVGAGVGGTGLVGTEPGSTRVGLSSEVAPVEPVELQAVRRKRRRLVGVVTAAAGAAAAAVVAVALAGTSSAPPSKTVALSGEPGVTASISLASQSWGTRATLQESGQPAGQVLTVAMKTASGRWWVAGSYRTTGRSGPMEVQLSCAVPANQITDVWVRDQAGHTVLNGYVS
jgi:hypothetical protein